MPSSASTPATPLDPAFRAAFLRASGPAAVLRFDAFMALALYDPALGYYRRSAPRVGRDRHTDFYTSTSLGPLFGELAAAACANLLATAGLDPAAHTFVELGAEPSGGVLASAPSTPFAATRTLRLGDPLHLSGPCVVFSNELFDAQPVRRFLRHADSTWHELGVALDPAAPPESATLHEHDLGPLPASDPALAFLPPADPTPEGYLFDAPLAAADLAAQLAAQPWHGLFVAFDYGKTFPALAHDTPQGTARAYFQHTQHNDLLARPGAQDLTAHVCWDWLSTALSTHGCLAPRVDSQESFFVHHAGPWIAAALAREGASSTPRKRALLHLLHPAQMGQKFQVLHALRAYSETSASR